MRVIVLLAVLAPLALAGCGKKSAKSTAPDSSPPPGDSPPGGSSTGPGVVPSGAGGGVVTNPGGAVGGGGGGGAAMAVRKAARRTQALNELRQLGLTIEFLYNDTGRMPTKEQILAALKQDRAMAKVLEGIDEGAYILTGTTDHAGLWAYEVDAEKVGGVALVAGVAQRATADDVRRFLR